MFRRSSVGLCLFAFAAAALALDPVQPKQFPGPTKQGFLLPNGWTLSPVGKHVELSDLPLNIIPMKDARHAVVASDGFNAHRVCLIDTVDGKVISDLSAYQSWFGLAMDKAESKVWWSGGGRGVLHTATLKDGKFARTSEAEPNIAEAKGQALALLKGAMAKEKRFQSGLVLDEARDTLYTLDINQSLIHATNLKDDTTRSEKVASRPYDVLLARNNLLYVTDWAGRQVCVVDPADLKTIAKIPVGEHPNQIVAHPKDARLFVACASTNNVYAIDHKRGTVTEVIHTSLFPRAPEGSTPCALAVSPDGKMLYVANADNNCVAVVDVEKANESIVKGFIPTGWYPTSVGVSVDGKNILIGVGKGLQSKANPLFTPEQLEAREKDGVKAVARKMMPYPYIGTTMSGALSVVPVPDGKTLEEYTATVYRNCPYSDKQLTAAPSREKTAIPNVVGDPSPIEHVIYIIKENRTYDQVFGELKQGNGDPALCMFPRKVTPNHHKLAEEFVLLDNLYCNGQVSRDGHPWSTMAYHTDYIARDWHLTYSSRKGVNDDDEGNLANAPSGHIWDACKRAGVSYRAYGEAGKRVSDGMGGDKMEGRVPGLVGKMSPNYGLPRAKGQPVRDTERVEDFLAEFADFEKNNNLPKFIVMSLPEDHTTGTAVGTFTPQACVANNDLALGRLVEAVSKSKYWKKTAIFVIEDDAQNGPDHVDAHRTVALVISPYTKRRFVDSTQYSTVSMIRTMELILGLPPLSQYDAAARPMFESFTDVADPTGYTHAPAQIDVDTKNTRLAYGSERSDKMDFSEVDLIDDFELNEILWRSIRGKDAPLPPAVRRAIAFRSLAVEKKEK